MSDPKFASSVVSTASAPSGSLALDDRSDLTKIVVRTDPASAAAGQLGCPHGRSRRIGPVVVLGQRPTEWLVIGPALEVGAVVDELDTSGHTSVIDITHSRSLFALRGADGARVMEKVNGLDWSDAMMPDGAVTGGSVAKVTCDLSRQDEGGSWSAWVMADRSFGQYLFDAIADACREFD